jgi:hypothetical protein
MKYKTLSKNFPKLITKKFLKMSFGKIREPLWFGFVCHEDIKTQIRNSFMEVQNKMDF